LDGKKEFMAHLNAIIFLSCLLSLFALGGCGRQDVSTDPKYAGGFVRGATYRLLVDAQYFTENGGFITIEATYNGRNGAFVPKGVRVQLDRIELESDPIGANRVYYMGHFVDGPFAGRNIIMNDTTMMMPPSYNSERDPEVLEPVP
jgi:hypothetical protein